MGTFFKEIYNLNAVIKNDARLNGKPINQKYALYYEYLKHSMSYFEYDCYKSLEYIPFTQEEYYFIGNGTDNQFLLSPSPPSNSLFYVGVRENSDNSYDTNFSVTFDSITNILTISPTPMLNYEVYVSAYIIGEFVEKLNNKECSILAQGMLVPYDQEQLQKQALLNQRVYGGSYKQYSQAEHIKQVKDVTENQYYKIVKAMINEYTYKQNPNKLLGLGGGLI